MSFRAGEKLFLAFFLNLYYTVQVPAGVLELVDEVDSKSIGGNTVRVQVPQPADLKALENIGFFLYFQGLSVF